MEPVSRIFCGRVESLMGRGCCSKAEGLGVL